MEEEVATEVATVVATVVATLDPVRAAREEAAVATLDPVRAAKEQVEVTADSRTVATIQTETTTSHHEATKFLLSS